MTDRHICHHFKILSAEKQNELWIVSYFLTPVVVKGRILSADALHIQQACCGSTTRWQGDYVLIATDKQPTLADDLRHFFSELPADCRDWRTARAVDKGHGRLEIREVVVSTELNALLAGKWTGVAQVCPLPRQDRSASPQASSHLVSHLPAFLENTL